MNLPAPASDPFARQHRNWEQWFGRDADAIRAATKERARSAMAAWGLHDAEPFGSGNVAYVYRGRLANGTPAVLKVDPTSMPGTPKSTAEALVIWGKAGLAPRVLGTRDAGRTLLLELVEPGTPLAELVRTPYESSLAVIADLARQLRATTHQRPSARFATITDYARAEGWHGTLERHHPNELPELRRLLAEPADTLIHNDLHHHNVLRCGDRWLVIDPKPVLADPQAECFALLAGAEDVTRLDTLERYARTARMPDVRLLFAWVRLRATILSAVGAQASSPTSMSASWNVHLTRLASLLAPYRLTEQVGAARSGE